MKTFEKDEMLVSAENLLKQITKVLDAECQEIDGQLRVKLGLAELNLHKIIQLMRKE